MRYLYTGANSPVPLIVEAEVVATTVWLADYGVIDDDWDETAYISPYDVKEIK